MSNDHKPTNKGKPQLYRNVSPAVADGATEETARITAAGGFVEFGRVNGKRISIITFTVLSDMRR